MIKNQAELFIGETLKETIKQKDRIFKRTETGNLLSPKKYDMYKYWHLIDTVREKVLNNDKTTEDTALTVWASRFTNL